MISPKQINDLSERVKEKAGRGLKSRYPIRYGLIPTELIVNPHSPDLTSRFIDIKEDFDNLLKSVKEEGLRNPLIGKSQKDGKVLITVGYSRAWAVKMARLPDVPCLINDVYGHYEYLELINNIDHARTKFIDQPYTVKILIGGITSSEPMKDGKSWWSDENKKIFNRHQEITKHIETIKQKTLAVDEN